MLSALLQVKGSKLNMEMSYPKTLILQFKAHLRDEERKFFENDGI